MESRPVEVHLYGSLRRFAQERDPAADSVVFVPVAEGETIGALAARIGIPFEEIGRNVFLDGALSSLSREVRGGERLALFPPDMNLLYRWYFPQYGNEG